MFYSAGGFFLFIDLTFSARGAELTREAKVAHLHFTEKVCRLVSMENTHQTQTQPALFSTLRPPA